MNEHGGAVKPRKQPFGKLKEHVGKAKACERHEPKDPNDRSDKFTGRARKVLMLAQEEANRLNHNYIGTEHLLLGLVREGEGIAAKALASMGVELEKVRLAVDSIIGRDDRDSVGDGGLTPRTKKVIELAVDEARILKHRYIGTEHLLLGLIREGDGIAAGVLENLGVNLQQARTEVLRILADVGQTPKPIETKNNVVTCRLGDGDLAAIDALVEAGIRSTRSDAAAWLIHAGIDANRPLFERVHATVTEIHRLRAEAQDMAQQLVIAETPADASAPTEQPSDRSEGRA